MHIDDIDTPALVLDLDVCEHNIRRFQRLFDGLGVGFRPHIKTHKIPELAHWQVDAGAIGITCQKLGEVEVMANAGLDNILLYFNIVGEPKLERLCRLSQACDLTVTADSPVVADAIGAAAVRQGVVVNVLAELNSFIDRTGVPTVSELVELARHIDRTPGLNLRGMATYPTSRQSADRIAEAVQAFDQAGLNREIVSGGGTPTAFEAEAVKGLTEHRAGTYIFMDRQCIDRGVATAADCALQVLTTVVSNPVPHRADHRRWHQDVLGRRRHAQGDRVGLPGSRDLPDQRGARLPGHRQLRFQAVHRRSNPCHSQSRLRDGQPAQSGVWLPGKRSGTGLARRRPRVGPIMEIT